MVMVTVLMTIRMVNIHRFHIQVTLLLVSQRNKKWDHQDMVIHALPP